MKNRSFVSQSSNTEDGGKTIKIRKTVSFKVDENYSNLLRQGVCHISEYKTMNKNEISETDESSSEDDSSLFSDEIPSTCNNDVDALTVLSVIAQTPYDECMKQIVTAYLSATNRFEDCMMAAFFFNAQTLTPSQIQKHEEMSKKMGELRQLIETTILQQENDGRDSNNYNFGSSSKPTAISTHNWEVEDQ